MADEPVFAIVGGGPAAVSAARGYRDAGGQGRVLICSADPKAPYFRPALSKEFLRGETSADDIGLDLPDGVELRLGDPVTELWPDEHRLSTVSGSTVDFASCVLATGARPAVPGISGADRAGVRTLRSLEDSGRLRGLAVHAASVTVVGAGFIGCEAAVSLARIGKTVTLTAPSQVPQQQRLGPVAGAEILRWLHEEGVRTEMSAPTESIVDGPSVRLADGRAVHGDLVLLATGIQPNSELGQDAGLALGSHRIRVDARMRTTAPDIYAAGDVALADNATAQRALPVEHWGEALTMGEIAGRNAAGSPVEWDNPPGFWSELGDRALKYVAWGDGFDETVVCQHGEGAFTVWYGSRDVVVGVLTHEADEDYERGARMVAEGAPLRR